MRQSQSRVAALAAGSLAFILGSSTHGQVTIGGDEFAPGEADFVQSGQQVGRGPAFQFSDAFYAANGIDAAELRAQEEVRTDGALAPVRFDAFYRGTLDDAGVKTGDAPDDRFIDDTRHSIHNVGFNAAGEHLFYPDPLSFFFESAFLNQETKDLTNISFVYGFPRVVQNVHPDEACADFAVGDLLNPTPCGRRQDNIFDTGNGYLTSNPLQLWRLVFVNWDGPDVDSPECQAEMASLAARNGVDLDGTPILTTTAEVLKVAGPNLVAGQGDNEVVLPNTHPGGNGLPNPDIRGDIPGVEPEERGQVCVTVRTRRQEDELGNPASAHNTLDGPPFVV